MNKNNIIKPSKPANIYRRGKPIQKNETNYNSSSNSNSDEESTSETETKSNNIKQQQQQKINLPIISIQSDSLDKTLKPALQPKVVNPTASTLPESDSSSSSDSSSNEDEETSDDDDDESEEDEEEEEKLAPIYKPVFISKKNRQTLPTIDQSLPGLDDVDLEAQKKIEEENLKRKLSSKKLVEKTLIREQAEKEVGEVFPDVDDTDGLDPEGEFESWKLRELTRLKRDREILIQKAKEKEEIEARRALPESQRLKEDLEFAEKTRKSRRKTKQVFLQKYHHKGAFYNDSEILKKHDYTAPTEGTSTKMELLPSVMQVRDFGKMSRSKWTHLSKEDTTSVDAGWYQTSLQSKNPKNSLAGGCFKCGQLGHFQKDCVKKGTDGSQTEARGANKVEIGTRRNQTDERESLKRREDSDRDVYPSKRREVLDHRRPPSQSSPPPQDSHQRVTRETRDLDHYRPSDDRYRADSYSNRHHGSRRDDRRSRSRDRSPSPPRDKGGNRRDRSPSPRREKGSSWRYRSPSPRRDKGGVRRDRSPSPRRDKGSSRRDRSTSPRRDKESGRRDRSLSPRRDKGSSSRDRSPSPRRDKSTSRRDRSTSPRREKENSRRDRSLSPRRDRDD